MTLALVQSLQWAKSQIQRTWITYSTAELHWKDCLFVGEYSEVLWIFMQICNECRKSFFYLCDSVSLQQSLFTTKATLNTLYSSIYFRATSLEFYIFFVLLTDLAYAYKSCQISTKSSHEKCKFDFNV